MAAERNPYYGTNGAAAYDVYSANTVRQPVREPERRELPQEAPQKRQRVRARTAIAPFTILGAAITACMMILVIFGYVQLFEASSRVSRLESRLQSLQEEQLLLQSKYEGKIDLAAIEQRTAQALAGADRLRQSHRNRSGGDLYDGKEQHPRRNDRCNRAEYFRLDCISASGGGIE